MSDDSFDEIRIRSRQAYMNAESRQEEAARELMRNRHELDIAEAAYVQAKEAYELGKAQNEKARESLDQAKAKFLEVFGEEP